MEQLKATAHGVVKGSRTLGSGENLSLPDVFRLFY